MEWIHENVEKFNLKNNLEDDFSLTIWGKILLQNFKDEISESINNLKILENELKEDEDLIKYFINISNNIDILEQFINKNYTFDELYEIALNFKLEPLPKIKNLDSELAFKTKKIKNNVSKKITDLIKATFIYKSKDANEDIYQMYDILKTIESIINKFSNQYQKNKEEKNIVDFTDIEHFALNILVKKDSKNNYIPTDVAKKYRNAFKEIAVDEYQDSNLVQEYILKTISNDRNIFMVGDVKQSIYKFRQARPELFLQKYDSYFLPNNDERKCIENTKIKLFKNFRSRLSIINFTNLVFYNLMSKKLGDIEYSEGEFLNKGIDYSNPNDKINFAGNVELNIIDLQKENEDEENNDEDEIIENKEIEAKLVANKIHEMINSNYYIYDKKDGYRKATFKDFLILLRTTSATASVYEKILEESDIPVFNDVSQSYFETEEIDTIMSLLKVIDNPTLDIPLVSVLRSQIGNFTDNELLEIRLESNADKFYNAMLEFSNNKNNDKIQEKINKFLSNLEQWQQKQEILALDEFIWNLYQTTGYYDFVNSMPNGKIKVANLKLLFEKAKDYEKASFKGLYNFVNYIEKIKKTSGDTSSAKIIGENENVVRIMSIHKSKGLEFPIVFLCGTGKQFNMQDLNQNILLHQDLGFGPKYINYDKKITYSTLAKEAIKLKMKNEILSEEMRLLYVAITRAKEKLIITGVDKDYNKSMDTKKENVVAQTNEKIIPVVVKNAKSYLDWLEMVTIKDTKKIIDINIYNKNIKELNLKVNTKKSILKETKTTEEINKLLNWKYPYDEITKIEGKSSVSKISKSNDEEIQITMKPKFLEDKKLNSEEKGSLVHLVFEKLDFRKNYNIENIKELIQNMEKNKIISTEEVKNINVNKILNFVNSDLYKRIQQAKYIFKEQPFYINIPALEKENAKDNVLIQGIIDLYFIENDGKIILVDYKTDYVEKDISELVQKYKNQLELYKIAIEKATDKNVSETYIYSVFLDKEIEI
jgi:ATP-dependent helicase/nuclease subunit A